MITGGGVKIFSSLLIEVRVLIMLVLDRIRSGSWFKVNALESLNTVVFLGFVMKVPDIILFLASNADID